MSVDQAVDSFSAHPKIHHARGGAWVSDPGPANARLRPAVTAMAPEQEADACAPRLDTTTDGAGSVQAGARKARYRWAMLRARIDEAFALTCPHCAGEMRIIASVTDRASIQAILAHMGESTRPPPLAPTHDAPVWAGDTDAGEVMAPEGGSGGIDPLSNPNGLHLRPAHHGVKIHPVALTIPACQAPALRPVWGRKRALMMRTGPGSP
jgi:hypothetical protein